MEDIQNKQDTSIIVRYLFSDCQFGDEDPGYCSKKLRMDPRSCADDEFQQGCCETCERRG